MASVVLEVRLLTMQENTCTPRLLLKLAPRVAIEIGGSLESQQEACVPHLMLKND